MPGLLDTAQRNAAHEYFYTAYDVSGLARDLNLASED